METFFTFTFAFGAFAFAFAFSLGCAVPPAIFLRMSNILAANVAPLLLARAHAVLLVFCVWLAPVLADLAFAFAFTFCLTLAYQSIELV